jgi:hypothetical protein
VLRDKQKACMIGQILTGPAGWKRSIRTSYPA